MTATTSRLLTLLSLLQTTRDWPGSVLAERLEVSPRTVRRDVDRLRELGYNIAASMGPEGGYRLDAGNQLPPLLFDDDQVVALTVALRSVGAALEEPAVRALSTVRQVLPSRLRHRVDALQFTSITHPPGGTDPAPVSTDVLVALSAAVRSRVVLRFDYGAGATPRRDRPAQWNRTTSSPRWDGGIWSRGVAIAPIGASSVPIASPYERPTAHGSSRDRSRAAMRRNSSRPGSRAPIR